MAFGVTMLSWAAIDFNKELLSLNQLGHTLEAIKWGTDYFIKAHTQPNVLWAQVPNFCIFLLTLLLNIRLISQSFHEFTMMSTIFVSRWETGCQIIIVGNVRRT